MIEKEQTLKTFRFERPSGVGSTKEYLEVEYDSLRKNKIRIEIYNVGEYGMYDAVSSKAKYNLSIDEFNELAKKIQKLEFK